jgi:branched-chain amino acid transport system substrate-binding protein
MLTSVIVFADESIQEMLEPLFTASNKILLMVNMGAGYPDNWQSAPTTITHSLNFCWHAALSGTLAAKANKNVINAISYYDGGYRQCFSMLNAKPFSWWNSSVQSYYTLEIE